MINIRQIFNKRWDSVNTTIILTILGFEIKIRKKYSLPTMNRQIATLNYFINNCADIRQVKKADGTLRNVQQSCIKMLDKVDAICKNNNLCYWLDAGTLLGCIRHKGFIPWDDDIDICMPRKDYNIFVNLLKSYFKENEIRLKAELDNNFQIRIISQNNDAALDIFPIDNYITSNLNNKQKKEITDLIKNARNIFDKNFPAQKIKNCNINKLKTELINIQNRIVLQNQKVTMKNPALFYGIDFPYYSKYHLIYNHDEIFPLSQGLFEGKYYPIPNKSDDYLKNIYGNYMKFPTVIPNIEKYLNIGEIN